MQNQGTLTARKHLRLVSAQPAEAIVRDDDAEIVRLYGMSDAWLGAELLRTARQARNELAEDVGGLLATTFERRLLWDVIPEIAHRLGGGALIPNEAMSSTLRMLDAEDLRDLGAQLVSRVEGMHAGAAAACWGFLTREVSIGNPVAIAIDRLRSPLFAGDFVSARVQEAWSRLGFSDRLVWTPDLVA